MHIKLAKSDVCTGQWYNDYVWTAHAHIIDRSSGKFIYKLLYVSGCVHDLACWVTRGFRNEDLAIKIPCSISHQAPY